MQQTLVEVQAQMISSEAVDESIPCDTMKIAYYTKL